MNHVMAHREHIGAVVVARMDSSRLPGKPLLDIAGKPLIERVLERVLLAGSALDGVVVATTNRPIDNPIADWCAQVHVHCHRDQGGVDDVAGRLLRAAEGAGFTWSARVNADSPLVDGRLVARGVKLCQTGIDLVTNLLPRRYPYGMAVEVIRTCALRQELRDLSAEEREHVTIGLYRRWNDERVATLSGGDPAWATIRTTVDDPADLARMRGFIEAHLANWPMIAMPDVVAWASTGVAA